MTTRSICISAAVLLLALTLTWPALPDQSNTDHIGQSSGAGAGALITTETKPRSVQLGECLGGVDRLFRHDTDPFTASARLRLAARQRNFAPVRQFDETTDKLASAFDDVFGAFGQAFW